MLTLSSSQHSQCACPSSVTGEEREEGFFEIPAMSYDDVEIEDMEWNEEIQAYTYPCPCGDLFQITKEDLRLGEEIANCPSCSLYITVIYNMEDFQNDTKKKNNEPKSSHPIAVA